MPPSGGKRTPIDPSIVSRVAGVIEGAIRGAATAWMGPGEPMQPVVTGQQAEEVRGRQWDYPIAVNTNTRARAEAGEGGISFETLRALADPTLGGLDLLRIAIDKRKDQMESQEWTIRGRDGTDGGPRARDIEKLLRKPDRVNTRAQWTRMLVEDLLVIDAPCIYYAPSTLGYRVPQIMDGALVKRLMGIDGRTPLPPDMAYSQNIKGMPVAEYTLDELTYLPRNLRSHRIYGQSPVQQVTMTLDIAIRRQLSQRERYTAGSVPEVLLAAPEGWDKDQIKAFQLYLDTVLSGDTEALRRMRMVPGGITPFMLKPGQEKDEWDDWLARIICWAFSLSPQALTKQMNRATADTAKESAQEEGLEPLKLWFKSLLDEILEKAFDEPELELAYADEEITDPTEKADVMATALGKGGGKPWFTQDEVREAFGKQPMTAAQKEELQPAPPPTPALGPDGKPVDDPAVKPGVQTSALTAKRLTRRVEIERNDAGAVIAMKLQE